MLSFSLSGPIEITLEDRSLDEMIYAKAQSVLAYLAVEQRRQFRRTELAALFWPDASHETGLANLRYTLHRLRKVLGDGVSGGEPYLVVSSQVRFNPASRHRLDVLTFSTDLAEAEDVARHRGPQDMLAELERVAALYRGEFLQGMTFDPATELGDWVQAQRSVLSRRACALLSILSRAHENRAALRHAIRFARRQSEIDPADEEAQRRIMRLLARGGQTQAALAHYDLFKVRLAHELATDPSTDTVQLARTIRSLGASGIGTPPHPHLWDEERFLP